MNGSLKPKVVNEAHRIEEDALYSAKGHFEAARLWTNFHYYIGLPTVVMAAVAGATALSRFDGHGTVAGILALAVMALTAVATFVDPCAKANSHRTAGSKYNALRNEVRVFREVDIATDEAESSLQRKLREYGRRRDELNLDNPLIPRGAYLRAKRGIEAGEAEHAVDRAA